jgi:hypothetical protein
MRIKQAPSNCPLVQQIVLPISGENGYVISTKYSNTIGNNANDDAPINPITTYIGPMPAELGGAKISPMYEATMIGMRMRMEPR